jgi:hypothetical protein
MIKTNFPNISFHLDALLRQMNEDSDMVVSKEDLRSLIIIGYVSLRIRNRWVVNKNGLQYLADHPNPPKANGDGTFIGTAR